MACHIWSNFNPRSPHGERRSIFMVSKHTSMNFNPRSPHGERLHPPLLAYNRHHFNPRSPHGERRAPASGRGRRCSGISIHAPRTGSDRADEKCGNRTEISIHAPRTGSDRTFMLYFFLPSISIHAPRTGSDGNGVELENDAIFQSTLPARGATARNVRR